MQRSLREHMSPPNGTVEAEIQRVIMETRSGQLDSARMRVDRLLQSHPNRADVRMAKGMLLMSRGDYASSVEWLKASLELNPKNLEALAWAAYQSIHLTRYEEAEPMARSFTEISPDNPRAFFLLAAALKGLNRTQEGIAAIDRSLALRPDDPEALVLKARLLRDRNLHGLAMEFYKLAQAGRPYPAAAIDLAQIWLRESRPEEALRELLAVLPQLPEGQRPHELMAQAYTEMMEFENADAHWKLAENYSPNRARIIRTRAASEIAVGRFEIAEQILARAIEHDVEPGACFYLLTTARRIRPDDGPLIDRIVRLLESKKFEPAEAANASFGLGKAFDDLRDYERAIGYFDQANQVVRTYFKPRNEPSEAAARAFTDFMIGHFTEGRLKQLEARGLTDSVPLLVVGMHRSGTTLTESVLSSHSKVAGRGEQSFWLDRISECFEMRNGVPGLRLDLIWQFASEYSRLMKPKGPAVLHVVDKNPANYQLVPLIHGALPDAKFVHLKRHAVDNLLSMWMTPFSEQLSYLSNRQTLVALYKDYLRLMAHFESVMPKNRFKTFRYEDLTSNPEPTIGAMLEFVGLEPEEACFHPELAKRAVLTPSVLQVRQPINTRSQDRWKNYEPWLGPFAELLGS
jgi:tetratricopeptide (TPR) repeat protein